MARLQTTLAAAACACAALAGGAAGQSSSVSGSASGSSSLFADIPLCDQVELVEVSDIMTTNARKLQCQETLGVDEMLTVDDPLTLCDVTSCVAALQVLYSTLPQCRYQDWPIQYQCELLLKNCGITPINVTESSDAGSFYYGSASDASSADAGDGNDGATTWNVTSSDSSSAFAPVGVTPTPTTATPTPTPTPTDNSASAAVASAIVACVALISAVATAL